MRLGERSTGIGPRDGGQLIRAGFRLLVAGCVLAPAANAWAASVGPDRIICNASFCEMGSAARPKQRVRVIVSELPREEIRRLRKCTGVAKPCIVIIDGTERGDPMKIMASAIHWQD
ncbi:MAG: hypothetical protein P4L90_06300 [Rhodopila sp.]|nr:hypothetical protein [Rhodopila sp.]